jgi:pentatricopeptide repeat protein
MASASPLAISGAGGVWGVLSLALSILALILIFILWMGARHTRALTAYNSRLSEAVGFLATGDSARGTAILIDLCLAQPDQVLTYKILADRYLQAREIDEAEKVLIRMKRVFSAADDFSDAGFKEIVRLKIEKQREAEEALRKKEEEARNAAEAAQKALAPKKKPRAEEEEFEPVPPDVPAF